MAPGLWEAVSGRMVVAMGNVLSFLTLSRDGEDHKPPSSNTYATASTPNSGAATASPSSASVSATVPSVSSTVASALSSGFPISNFKPFSNTKESSGAVNANSATRAIGTSSANGTSNLLSSLFTSSIGDPNHFGNLSNHMDPRMGSPVLAPGSPAPDGATLLSLSSSSPSAPSGTEISSAVIDVLLIPVLYLLRAVQRFFEFLWHTVVVGILWGSVVYPIADLVVDVGLHWMMEIRRSLSPRYFRVRSMSANLAQATSYVQWRAFGLVIDREAGNNTWKLRFEDPDYDYILVRDRLEDLYQARKRDNRRMMAFLLRTTLERNLGNMGNPALHHKCNVGTKDLIEQYIDEVVYQLNYLSVNDIPGMTHDEKIQMFVHIRQAFGRSALLLSGGGGLGIYHFGVIQALHEQNLLPRIISGSSVGSLVSALICTTPPAELSTLLSSAGRAMRNPYVLTRKGEPDDIWAKIAHYCKHGVLCDVEVLKQACRDNIGDVTFQEAFDKTRRILNITINSPDKHEAPRLLNFLTAPNVIIWSAACASCALHGLFEPVVILCKDQYGQPVPWNPQGQTWSDGSVESDLPATRLSELFNVNHHIVSQVNPHVVPILALKSIMPKRVLRFLTNEVIYRCDMLSRLPLLPSSLSLRLLQLRNVLQQTYTGDITIVPNLWDLDYTKILTNPTPDVIQSAMHIGQVATWSRLDIIRTHCKIEMALDDIVHRLRGCELWQHN